ncbi:uncharacterized protein TA21070 [Theileria annulata]|uniref:RAP domain-containing protein n=1 Tax=Theileria annulata TaxID=5874 RepID=Q4UGU2_THEAN|nr:uncharacterized protein TA21070 [Theileria annulata]CAI73697.1 hypothetical protein TA21070 [Theileria annulata]|eukprot:XP_954374.1 hypothetical protein TA21070 [Theileria annulata]
MLINLRKVVIDRFAIKIGRIPHPNCRNPARSSIHTSNVRFYQEVKENVSETPSSTVDSTSITNILRSFIASNYDTKVLSQIFSLEKSDESTQKTDNLTDNKYNLSKEKKLDIDSYLTILKLCDKLSISELDLISPLSVNLNKLLCKLLENSTETELLQHKIKVLEICKIYNKLKILYDPLFLTISKQYSKLIEKFGWDDVVLLLLSFSIQRYNEPEIVKSIHKRLLEQDLTELEPSSAVSLYSSLANLEFLSPDVKRKLESKFVKKGEKIHNFDPNLNFESLITVAYSNLLLETPTVNDLQIVLSALSRISRLGNYENLSLNSLRTFTVVLSYIKCLHKDLYNSLPETDKAKLMEILLKYNETKRFKSSIFTDKVSEHLRRMRIRCETNVYKNGVLLDILESDQNLVWLCNSYHRFYATTFNMTANSKLLTKLIKAFGYKVSVINYYQWGRMKCKRTRFAFLRMARYYTLKDRRYSTNYKTINTMPNILDGAFHIFGGTTETRIDCISLIMIILTLEKYKIK